jgi:hypothetical protein
MLEIDQCIIIEKVYGLLGPFCLLVKLLVSFVLINHVLGGIVIFVLWLYLDLMLWTGREIMDDELVMVVSS